MLKRRMENFELNGSSSPSSTITVYKTYWFIGLEFKVFSETVDLDLTRPIQDFTDKGFL